MAKRSKKVSNKVVAPRVSAGSKKSGPRACLEPEVEARPLPPGLHPARESLIRVQEKKWVNGTVLHYYFFNRASDGPGGSWRGQANQKEAVRKAFQDWKSLGLGLEFAEVSAREEAEIRIGFADEGSWSYVGRDNVDVASDPNERTMNFGWDLTTTYGRDTALHEIGHALGFPHEHQNPNAGIVWDQEAVLQEFSGSPNFWTEDKIRWNILRKLSRREVAGSEWDANSIMHYEFGPGLIKQPAVYFQTGLYPKAGLSALDIKSAKQFYPPLKKKLRELKPFESQYLNVKPGEQVDFAICPDMSRKYTIQTFGASDTVMVLFDETSGEPRYLAADDDSGYEHNANMLVRLVRGHRYVLRVRLYYTFISGKTSVFMW